MKNYLLEHWYRLFGYRKHGLVGRRELFISDEVLAPAPLQLIKKQSHEVTRDNFYSQNQKNTPHCVGFTIAHYLSFVATLKAKKRVTIEGDDISKLLISAGILTKYGARLDLACEYVSNSDQIFDTAGVRYEVGKPIKFKRTDIKKVLSSRLPIITGASVKNPMCDDNYFLRSDGSYPHAFLLIPCNTENPFVYAKNSWKNFGIKYNSPLRSGQFKIWDTDFQKLFTPIIFENINPQ